MRLSLRGVLLAALVLLLLVAAPLVVPAALLVVAAETLAGRIAGFWMFVAVALLFTLCRFLARDPAESSRRPLTRTRRIVMAAALLLPLAALAWLAPPGGAPPGSHVRSRFLGSEGYSRFALANLVPEIDQVKLGTYLVSERSVRADAMAIYRPMERDPELHALGSVMNYAYTDRNVGHFYEYVPAHAAGERLPTLLFIHGSAGNFKAYFSVLRQFGEAHRMIVLCPSFGFGNWYEEGGVEAIERVHRLAIAELPVDPDRVYLVGLSNGGTGVTRAALARPRAYAGLVFLSAVMEESILSDPAFVAGWAGRRMLVIQGARDHRVEEGDAAAAVALLRKSGALVTYDVEPNQGHFLFFARREWTLDRVATFLEQAPGR